MLACQALEASQLVAQDHQRLKLSSDVCNLDLALAACTDGNGTRQRRLHRASPCKCAPPVVDPGKKSLLENVPDVYSAPKDPPFACMRDQLQPCLAVAILQVLSPEAVAMRSQQQLA